MQNSNHFKPSKYLDVKDILNQNYLLVDNATQLVNKVNKKIIELNQKFYKSTEQQQIQIQVDLDQLQLKLEDYNEGDKKIPFKIVGEYLGEQLSGISYEQLIPWIKPMETQVQRLLLKKLTTSF